MPSPLCSQHRRGLGVQLTPLPLDCFEHLSADHPELLVVHDVRLEPVLSGRHVPVVGSIRALAKYLVGTGWVAAAAAAIWCLLLCAILSSTLHVKREGSNSMRISGTKQLSKSLPHDPVSV